MGIALVGSTAKPADRLSKILGNTPASLIANTQIVLSLRVALLSSTAIPSGCFDIVLSHAIAIVIAVS